MNGYYTLVVAILKQQGYDMIRQKGSHQTWNNGRQPVTVSTNANPAILPMPS